MLKLTWPEATTLDDLSDEELSAEFDEDLRSLNRETLELLYAVQDNRRLARRVKTAIRKTAILNAPRAIIDAAVKIALDA